MRHHFLGYDTESSCGDNDRHAHAVADELTAEAIEAFAKGAAGIVRRMGYLDQRAKVIGESVAETVSTYLDPDGPRMLSLMAALQAAADGKPEARLMAQAWIAGFARNHADDWADEIAATNETVAA